MKTSSLFDKQETQVIFPRNTSLHTLQASPLCDKPGWPTRSSSSPAEQPIRGGSQSSPLARHDSTRKSIRDCPAPVLASIAPGSSAAFLLTQPHYPARRAPL